MSYNFLAICHKPPEVGPCKGIFPRWFYNASSSQCELFTYGGCQGNENKFGSLKECIKSCGEWINLVLFWLHIK